MTAAPQASPGSRADGTRDESAAEVLLDVRAATKDFSIGRGRVHSTLRAVSAVDLQVRRGETLAVVGESGCGKSTLGKMVTGLIRPTAGSIHLLGEDIGGMSERRLRRVRRHVQLVFQDPLGSLDPRMTVARIVAEPLRVHKVETDGAALRRRVGDLLERCGLTAGVMDRYPRMLSGGQQQRVGIARALALEPRLIVCDEPVSALDVSVQAQIINLLQDLQRDLGLSYLFISHDLGVVRNIADRVAVMYLGSVVEQASTAEIFEHQRHPYTKALFDSAPRARIGEEQDAGQVLRGEVPSPLHPPTGCVFHPRCPRAQALAGPDGIVPDDCSEDIPVLGGPDDHVFACWHPLLEPQT
jgi:oligopeptide/dipeptide ABC transporter ATP-binding protein